jgi:hypothetical protein
LIAGIRGRFGWVGEKLGDTDAKAGDHRVRGQVVGVAEMMGE